MLRALSSLTVACGVALSALHTSAYAQSACTPEKLNAAIDSFAGEPFGARSWRMLNGLGDPDLPRDGLVNGYWAAVEAWKKRVAEIGPEMPELGQVAYNCRMSYPLEVLEQRVAKLGVADPYVKQWLKTQARVLKACDGAGADQTALPPPIEVNSELVKIQQDDRAYQEAAVVFYQDKPKAIEMFRAIAASDSAHKPAARYNIANLLANANNVVEARSEAKAVLADPALASVHDITKELLGYIANIEDTAAGWSELIDNTVATLSQPAAAVSATPKSAAEFAAALYDIDYAGVRAKQDDWWIENRLPENPTLSKALVDASRKHPMVLWMMTGQTVDANYAKAPWALVGEKWNSWNTSFVDRALALQPAGAEIKGTARDLIDGLKSSLDDISRAALWSKAKAALEAAQTSCGTAPETAAAAQFVMQSVRLSALAGKFDEAYSELDAMPLKASTAYAERILPKLMEFILAKGDAGEGRRLRDRLLTSTFLAGVPETSRHMLETTYGNFLAWVAEDEAKWVEALKLSNARLASPIFNLLPAKALRKLAEAESFAPEQKALLARAAWTRDHARGRNIAAADTERMLALNPEIKTAFEAVETAYPKLRSDRQWLLTIVRNPRFGILVNSPDWTDPIETKRDNFVALDAYDHNDKNWWCPLETDRQLGTLRFRFDNDSGLDRVTGYHADALKPVVDGKDVEAAMLARENLLRRHPMIAAVNWPEVRSLAAAASAPKSLSLAAIRWGKASKGEDGAPEALALAVNATRYGCNWHGGHAAYSKSAQQLLTTKFKSTTWASQTPFWFGCMNEEWDKDGKRVANCKPKTWEKQKLPR